MGVHDAIRVSPANAAQLEAWDGDEGAYWAEHADAFDRSLAAYHGDFLDAAGITDGDHVLDVGCGAGRTTIDAARRTPGGAALGVDLSARMLEEARRRAADEGVGNARFVQADAQVHPFDLAGFDVAISRTGGMFFSDPVTAFANIARAVRPGGRLLLLTWQDLHRNEWIREISGALAGGRDRPAPPAGTPGPFSLADPDRVRSVLTAAGFADVELAARSEPMWFGDDAQSALRFVLGLLGWMLDGLDEDARRRAAEALHASLAAHDGPGGVRYGSAAWTVRAYRLGGSERA